jgi:hypothetical protein
MHSAEHAGEEAEPFSRDYGDVDIVLGRKEAIQLDPLLARLGYKPVSSFNSVQGETRLMYVNPEERLRIDIFRGSFAMCHEIPLGREAFHPENHPALGLVELLLTKLQIVKANEKDLIDAAALLAFHAVGSGPDDIDGQRFAALLAKDWGLWRTVTDNLAKLEAWAANAPARTHEIADRARELRTLADRAPKSLRWKRRAVVGDRVKWYEEPEEPETEMEMLIR